LVSLDTSRAIALPGRRSVTLNAVTPFRDLIRVDVER
jgi:hypothetical protein